MIFKLFHNLEELTQLQQKYNLLRSVHASQYFSRRQSLFDLHNIWVAVIALFPEYPSRKISCAVFFTTIIGNFLIMPNL